MKISQALLSFDTMPKNPDIALISQCVSNQVSPKKPLELVIFTCSTINDKYMFDGKYPWRYVSLNPSGNNLEADLPTIKNLIKKLNKIYPTKLTILIGNTDPYYIYTESFTKSKNKSINLLWLKYADRWKRYQNNLTKWLTKQGLVNFEIISWYNFEKQLEKEMGLKFETLFNRLLPKINTFFKQTDFIWEKNRLKLAFGPGRYFPTLKIPSDKTLDQWIKRKFTEYMLQGFFISIFFPNAILLQNEKPSLLRTSMYQPLIKKYLDRRLPIIYPFGIDNLNYQ